MISKGRALVGRIGVEPTHSGFSDQRLDRLSYLPIFGVGKLDFDRETSPSHLVLFVVDWHIAHSCKLYPTYTESSLSRFEPLRKTYFSTRVETFATPCHGRLNGWYFLTGSNRRLQTCKDCTLPTELRKYMVDFIPPRYWQISTYSHKQFFVFRDRHLIYDYLLHCWWL